MDQKKAESNRESVEPRAARNSPDTREFQPGDIISGRFSVVALIGEGATGAVYAVDQIFLKKRFALKTLNSTFDNTNSQLRFQKESQAASKLDHENIVKAVDFGVTDDDRFFMVMEFVDGQTLSQYIKKNAPVAPDEALKLLMPICFALAHAHEQGVIHRDLKPGNIVLTTQPRASGFVPKIVDFGIAKIVDEAEALQLTKTGEVFGTPLYMSPEQCTGDKVDHRTDIYSLGCVFYELLTGTTPFVGQTALEIMMHHRVTSVSPMVEASLGVKVPRDLEKIVQKMLAKEPNDRFQSANAVAEALVAFQQGAPVKTSHAAAEPHPAKRRWLTPAAITVVVLSIAAVICLGMAKRPALSSLHVQQDTKAESATKVDKQSQDTADSIASTINVYENTTETGKQQDGKAAPLICTHNPDGSRTFHFGMKPADPNYTYQSEILCQSYSENNTPTARTSYKAAGEVKIPAHSDVEFYPSMPVISDHPNVFTHFRRGDFERLVLEGSAVICGVEPTAFNINMQYVGALTWLKSLRIAEFPLTTQGLANLKLENMHQLTDLTLIGCESDLTGIKLPYDRLDGIVFSEQQKTAFLLKELAKHWNKKGPVPRRLVLRADQLTDEDLAPLAGCYIFILDLTQNPKLTDAGLKHIGKIQSLGDLALNSEQFHEAQLKSVAKSVKLRIFRPNAPWRPEQVKAFQSAVKDCEIVVPNN